MPIFVESGAKRHWLSCFVPGTHAKTLLLALFYLFKNYPKACSLAPLWILFLVGLLLMDQRWYDLQSGTLCHPQKCSRSKIVDMFRAKCLSGQHSQAGISQFGNQANGVIKNSINHAMVYACDCWSAVLLDPTTSIVVVSPLQDIVKGKPVGISQMIDYYAGFDELLEQVRRKLRGALRNGGIRNSDLVYNKLL